MMSNKQTNSKPEFQRIKLSEEQLSALNQYIPTVIMNDHYNINHKGYENSFNKIWNEQLKDLFLQNKLDLPLTIEDLLRRFKQLPFLHKAEYKQLKEDVRFFAGGLANHNYFFNHLKLNKTTDTEPIASGDFLKALKSDFDYNTSSSFFSLVDDFQQKIINQVLDNTIDHVKVGSYWTWLVLAKDKKLKIIKTPYQDSPLMQDLQPLIAIDMWEHAYIKKYNSDLKGKREYVETLVKECLDWKFISEQYSRAFMLQ